MSWLVKGYGGKTIGAATADDRKVYSEVAQYIPDMQLRVREAVTAGATEIIIVKRGEREEGKSYGQSSSGSN